jgi:hypothetical protein
MPEPISRNCRMPASTRKRTDRRRNALLAWAISGVSGTAAIIALAASRSTAKLCDPPRK